MKSRSAVGSRSPWALACLHVSGKVGEWKEVNTFFFFFYPLLSHVCCGREEGSAGTAGQILLWSKSL